MFCLIKTKYVKGILLQQIIVLLTQAKKKTKKCTNKYRNNSIIYWNVLKSSLHNNCSQLSFQLSFQIHHNCHSTVRKSAI